MNSRFNLEDKVEDAWIVRKILRSLPERFGPKVTAIKGSKNLNTICVEEPEVHKKKGKSIANIWIYIAS
jgi:hypothetical protein